MYTLYWAADSGALAPQILLEEIGVEYRRQVLDLDKGDESSDEFLQINPRGQVPALLLDDGSVVTESAAICLHLADSHPAAGLAAPPGSPARARLYRWMFFAAANIYEGVLRIYYADRYTADPAQAELVRGSARDFVDRCWALLEDELGDGPCLLGETYSLADPYLLMLSNWHENRDSLFASAPRLARLCETVRARPAVERIWGQHFGDD